MNLDKNQGSFEVCENVILTEGLADLRLLTTYQSQHESSHTLFSALLRHHHQSIHFTMLNILSSLTALEVSPAMMRNYRI